MKTQPRPTRSNHAASRGLSRERILDAAERLMADDGYAAVSIRDIAAAAETQLSAVNYHFGSKEGLFEAVFERRASALNSERSALLDEAERSARGKPKLDAILEAFCQPAFMLARHVGGRRFLQINNQLLATEDALARRLKSRYFDPLSRRMVELLAAARPELDASALHWRYNFTLGSLYSALRDTSRIESLSNGKVTVDYDVAERELLAFLLSGWRRAANHSST